MSKAVGGFAALVFLLAPLTDTGLIWMAISIIVCLICMGAYMWSEPDVVLPSDEDEDSN